MPDDSTLKRVEQDKEEGKSASTQAGEFVRQEIEHIREGKHGARSTKQAIAIGLSEARRAGVKLPPPKSGQAKESTRKQAARDTKKGQSAKKTAPNPKRSRATTKALKREGKQAASKQALSKQAHEVAQRRTKQPATSKAPAKKTVKKSAAKKTTSKKTAAKKKSAPKSK